MASGTSSQPCTASSAPSAAPVSYTHLHAWEYASAGGYQQTRAMMCIASGGLFGLGAGNGWLKYVFAADTDLVFAFLCEEWGLIIGLCAVAVIVILAVFTVRSAKVGRSSFYTIAACAAVALSLIHI